MRALQRRHWGGFPEVVTPKLSLGESEGVVTGRGGNEKKEQIQLGRRP